MAVFASLFESAQVGTALRAPQGRRHDFDSVLNLFLSSSTKIVSVCAEN